MSNPIFIIVSKNKTDKKGGPIVGALACAAEAYFGARVASEAELEQIKERVSKSGTASLRDALLDGYYNPVLVFDLRKDARAAAKQLNATKFSYFKWEVVQFGEELRNLRKVSHWQIVFGDEADVSCENPAFLRSGVRYYGYSTRKLARAALKPLVLEGSGMGYRVVPVYA